MNRRRRIANVVPIRPQRRTHALRRFVMPAAILGGAALVGGAIGIAPSWTKSPATPAAYGAPISGCRVVDGDTLNCSGERIRLLAIDAPEMPGHCREGRSCVSGDPYSSTASLSAALSGLLTIDRVGEDRYGRTLARVAGDKGDLSCWQIARQQAVYKAGWDNGMRIARTCPSGLW